MSTTEEFDLDTLEREGDQGPFRVKLGGRSYEMVAPQVLDHRELLEVMEKAKASDVLGAIVLILDEKDREPFLSNKLPSFKLEALVKRYMTHYGLATFPEADASSPS